jgi:hypothetical protein
MERRPQQGEESWLRLPVVVMMRGEPLGVEERKGQLLVRVRVLPAQGVGEMQRPPPEVVGMRRPAWVVAVKRQLWEGYRVEMEKEWWLWVVVVS